MNKGLYLFLKANPGCLILAPSSHHDELLEIRNSFDGIDFSFMSLEELERRYHEDKEALRKVVERRSVYIAFYTCGLRISSVLGEYRNMSVSYLPESIWG